MTSRTTWIAVGVLAAAAVATAIAGGTAQAGSAGSAPSTTRPIPSGQPTADPAGDVDPPGDGVPITGDALIQAGAAALAHIGGGAVTETEVGDEEGYYEVEITRPDGSQVDVHLDERFAVLGDVADGPE